MDTAHGRRGRFWIPLRDVVTGDAGGGVILLVVAVVAMVAANSSARPAYEALFHGRLPWTPVADLDTAHLWINDGLMAVFFFVVGLEIKREVLVGDLADSHRRRMPVIAAIAGMAMPALCFVSIAGTALPIGRGWAIPGATDIAFAVGVVALLGPRVPPALRLFLLTVAIVDDLGAVAIIALFYTASIALVWLLLGAVVLVALILVARLRIAAPWPYAVLSVALWLCVLHSGVHATVAGVVAGLAIPLAPDRAGQSLLLRWEHGLQPLVTYAILPLFGFANAGIALAGGASQFALPLPLGIAVGLFCGKQIGVFGAIHIAERLGIAARPDGASWLQVWGIAILCGIGFTMSLFIAGLAFADHPALFDQAKLGVIAGSLLSIVAGYTMLRLASGRADPV